MPTPELIHCQARSVASTANHIVRATRHREHDGAATRHTHGGLTLCGAIVDTILPFVDAGKVTGNRCQDCLDALIEAKHATGQRAKERMVI